MDSERREHLKKELRKDILSKDRNSKARILFDPTDEELLVFESRKLSELEVQNRRKLPRSGGDSRGFRMGR